MNRPHLVLGLDIPDSGPSAFRRLWRVPEEMHGANSPSHMAWFCSFLSPPPTSPPCTLGVFSQIPIWLKTFISQPEPAPGEPAKLRPQWLPLSALPWSHRLQRQPLPRSPHGGSPTKVCSPDDRRLPLLPLMIFPLLPMLASLEVFSVPVSVRSIAISLRLRAAWILD